MIQSRQNLGKNVHGLFKRQRPHPIHITAQSLAFDILHDQIFFFICHDHIVNLHDVLMIQHGHGLSLVDKTENGLLVVCIILFQHFDGNIPVGFQVFGHQHRRHASYTEQCIYAVSPVKNLPDILFVVVH